jgi:hypothetical protein
MKGLCWEDPFASIDFECFDAGPGSCQDRPLVYGDRGKEEVKVTTTVVHNPNLDNGGVVNYVFALKYLRTICLSKIAATLGIHAVIDRVTAKTFYRE